jgi:hypothetical protein
MKTLPLFYSLNRYLEHDWLIGAGSVETCRATFALDARKKGEGKENLISVEGKLDTRRSVSLSLFLLTAGQGLPEIRSQGSRSLRNRRQIQTFERSRRTACKDEYGCGEENFVLQV